MIVKVKKYRILFVINNFHCKVLRKFRRYLMVKKLGICKDNTTDIRCRVYFDSPYKVKIGSNSMINSDVKFYTGEFNDSVILIGDNVKIGLNSTLITVTHEVGQKNQRDGACCAKAITIGDGCWIGANVTVLPGVHIAKGCIIGACSVVTKDTEANGLYVGNPARKIKRRLRRSS